jgi:hypothetical protein
VFDRVTPALLGLYRKRFPSAYVKAVGQIDWLPSRITVAFA